MSTSLKRHYEGWYLVSCDLCETRFATEGILIEHKRVNKHCNQCPKWFSDVGALKVHLSATHEGLSLGPPCNPCDASFKDKGELRVHMSATHEGLSLGPPCNPCDASFKELGWSSAVSMLPH